MAEKLTLRERIRNWKEENPEKAEFLGFVGGTAALCLTTAALGYAWGKSSGVVDGYYKGLDLGKDIGKGTGGIEGYREGYMAAYPVGYYNGSSRVLAVINKNKKDGDDFITPFPEMFDHPADYLEMILSNDGMKGLKESAEQLCDAGITADNMFNYDQGFNEYYEKIIKDDVPAFLEANKAFIEQKAAQRVKDNSYETIEI